MVTTNCGKDEVTSTPFACIMSVLVVNQFELGSICGTDRLDFHQCHVVVEATLTSASMILVLATSRGVVMTAAVHPATLPHTAPCHGSVGPPCLAAQRD